MQRLRLRDVKRTNCLMVIARRPPGKAELLSRIIEHAALSNRIHLHHDGLQTTGAAATQHAVPRHARGRATDQHPVHQQNAG